MKDHKMQTRRQLSLVTRKQHRNKIIQMKSFKWKQKHKKKNRTKT